MQKNLAFILTTVPGKVTGGKIANCGKYGIGAYKKGISYSKVKFSNNGANGKCNYYRG